MSAFTGTDLAGGRKKSELGSQSCRLVSYQGGTEIRALRTVLVEYLTCPFSTHQGLALIISSAHKMVKYQRKAPCAMDECRHRREGSPGS